MWSNYNKDKTRLFNTEILPWHDRHQDYENEAVIYDKKGYYVAAACDDLFHWVFVLPLQPE